jgi:hypothetical protein
LQEEGEDGEARIPGCSDRAETTEAPKLLRLDYAGLKIRLRNRVATSFKGSPGISPNFPG